MRPGDTIKFHVTLNRSLQKTREIDLGWEAEERRGGSIRVQAIIAKSTDGKDITRKFCSATEKDGNRRKPIRIVSRNTEPFNYVSTESAEPSDTTPLITPQYCTY